MKIRNDFVTNSSSSNFTIMITAIDKEDEKTCFAMKKRDFSEAGYISADFGLWSLYEARHDTERVTVNLDGKEINISKIVAKVCEEIEPCMRIENTIFSGRLFEVCRALARKETDKLSTDDKLLALAIARLMEEYMTDPAHIEKIEIEREFEVVETDDETGPICDDFFLGWEEVLLGEEDDETLAERYGTDVKSIAAYRGLMDSCYDFSGPLRETWLYDVKTDTMKKTFYARKGFIPY